MLSVTLNKTYKSFIKNFKFNLEGDFIIMSGKNGSGKTQLLDIISKNCYQEHNKMFDETDILITLNNSEILSDDILYKSFRDIINVSPFQKDSISYKEHIANQISSYNNTDSTYKSAYYNFLNLSESEDVKDQNGHFDRNKIIDVLSSEKFKEFRWESKDNFSFTNLSEIFKIYLENKDRYVLSKTDIIPLTSGEEFVKDNKPYWKLFNEIFKEFNFPYRFSEEYSLSSGKFLYPELCFFNTSLEKLDYGVSDLSDGEKAIFSLVVASVRSEIDNKFPKILLLDEYEATLNPSLLDIFLKILQKYFVDKGCIVIIATHNPLTLSFANNYKVSYYEVFNKDVKNRIVKNISFGQFSEISKEYKNYYTAISNEQSRSRVLIDLKEEIQKVSNDTSKDVLLITEGFTDKNIIEMAWKKLFPNKDQFFIILDNPSEVNHNASDVRRKLLDFELFNKRKVIGLFDFDREGWKHFDKLIKESSFSSFNFNSDCKTSFVCCNKEYESFAILLPLSNEKISSQCYYEKNEKYCTFEIDTKMTIELMFYGVDNNFDKEWFEEENFPGGGKIISFKHNKDKTNFAKALINLDQKYFENFKVLFQSIESISKSELVTS